MNFSVYCSWSSVTLNSNTTWSEQCFLRTPGTCNVWSKALYNKDEMKRKRRHINEQCKGEGSQLKFLYVFYQWHLAVAPAPPSCFSPFSIEKRCSSTPDYFYPTLHYHNKTHAWKKDKLKETAQPRTWIWEAYFHLSFLSPILLCCSFLFAQRNGKRHAFSFSPCLIMVLFRSAPLYGASPELCTGITEQPVDYPHSRVNTLDRATNQSSHRPCQV